MSHFSNAKIVEAWGCSKKKVFLKLLPNSQESTSATVSFSNKLSEWRLKTCTFIKNTPAQVFSCELCVFFLRKSIRPSICEWLVMKLEILGNLLIQFIKKLVYRKTSIQQNMIGEKMFCGKCFRRVIRTSDENSWKTS